VRLFMIISHVKIIAFQLSLFCKNYRFSKTVLYIINRIIHACLEIPYLFLVLNNYDISLVRCAHSWDIMFNTRNKYGISAHPCIILYLVLYYCNCVTLFISWNDCYLIVLYSFCTRKSVKECMSIRLNFGQYYNLQMSKIFNSSCLHKCVYTII
jgi:hypothetical protein